MTKKPSALINGKALENLVGELLISLKDLDLSSEVRMVKSLLKKHNNSDFWFYLSEHKKFLSFIYLLTRGDVIFHNEMENRNKKPFTIPHPSCILSEKIGPDTELPKKKTLLEFINS